MTTASKPCPGVDLAGISVEHDRLARLADAGELLQPLQRVERVAADEVRGALDGLAFPLVLVAPVGPGLRAAREVEVEVRREPCRPRSAGENDPQHVRVLVAFEHRPEPEQVVGGGWGEPLADVRSRLADRSLTSLEPRERIAKIVLEDELVVARGLHVHQQAVERGEIDSGGAKAALERLDERRARAGERIEDGSARGDVAPEELLDELGDELAEIGVKAMDVLRALPLRELLLRPRELDVELRVERILGRRHAAEFDVAGRGPREDRTWASAASRCHKRNFPAQGGEANPPPSMQIVRTSAAAVCTNFVTVSPQSPAGRGAARPARCLGWSAGTAVSAER